MSFAIIVRSKSCCRELTEIQSGGVAEWTKATVLKTVERKLRGFESYLLRHLSAVYAEYHLNNYWKFNYPLIPVNHHTKNKKTERS